jgi:hypothetical protein
MRVQTTRYGTRELTARRPLSAEQRLEMMRSTPETGASASRSNSSRSSARAIFLAVSWSDWGPCRALSVPTVCAAETAATICGQSAGGEQSDASLMPRSRTGSTDRSRIISRSRCPAFRTWCGAGPRGN